MRMMSKFLLVFSAVLFLGACDTVKGWTKGSGAADEEIKVSNAKAVAATDERLDGAPGVRPIPQFPVPQDRDLKVMTSKLSGGSVEIYDLEGDPAVMDSGIPPVQQDYNGIPLATDPRVTVYPVDGYTVPAGGMWPNAVLPVGHTASAGMTPPPSSFGGDRAMGIENGKLSSRTGPVVSNIYFPYGSARVEDDAVLNQVAQAAKFAPVDRVTVEGHASVPTQTNDPVKAKILNLKESIKRASAVSEGLIEKGVPAEKIKTVGWGDTKQTAGGEAEQRRVDVFTGAGP